MDFSTLSATSTASTAATTAANAGASSLGKDDFLRLLVAQMSNQDPLNPMDDTQFVSQLAQFSSLEQMMQVNANLGTLATTDSAMANAQVASLVGHQVVASGDGVSITQSGASPIQFSLGAAAAGVTVQISDANGNVVRTLEVGGMAAGSQSLAWDGRDGNGATLASGLYHASVAAQDANGAAVSVTQRVQGVVSSVSFESGYPELVVGGSRIRAADVLDVGPVAP
jgi:flagellar basal-body rod modification protein FlgD